MLASLAKTVITAYSLHDQTSFKSLKFTVKMLESRWNLVLLLWALIRHQSTSTNQWCFWNDAQETRRNAPFCLKGIFVDWLPALWSICFLTSPFPHQPHEPCLSQRYSRVTTSMNRHWWMIGSGASTVADVWKRRLLWKQHRESGNDAQRWLTAKRGGHVPVEADRRCYLPMYGK